MQISNNIINKALGIQHFYLCNFYISNVCYDVKLTPLFIFLTNVYLYFRAYEFNCLLTSDIETVSVEKYIPGY